MEVCCQSSVEGSSGSDVSAESLLIAVPRELFSAETRVAMTPTVARKFIDKGFRVWIEAGAGEAAGFANAAYELAGVRVVSNRAELVGSARIVLLVRPPAADAVAFFNQFAPGTFLISFLWPAQNELLLKALAAHEICGFAMDAVPRISRAQKFDALSSMANLAGYRAVVEAAHAFGRFFGGQITAAGRIPPAKVLVIGAGVAGLSAIGVAKGLGAIVRAFDTRREVKEQIESLGADFLELDFAEDGSGGGGYAKVMSEEFIAAEMALFAAQAREVDIIITTALIPGRPAPRLVTRDMVEAMSPGSVVVDMAAEQGGNCEVTVAGEIVTHGHVKIIGFTDLPGRMARQASELYASNLFHLVNDFSDGKSLSVDLDGDVMGVALVTYGGDVCWPPKKVMPPPSPSSSPATPVSHVQSSVLSKKSSAAKKGTGSGSLIVLGFVLLAVGIFAPSSFLTHLTVFVLACLVGWQIVWNVTPALHTPLMSVTNAISGIIVVGGMLQVFTPIFSAVSLLGLAAVFIGTINIAGGFLVTQRMLRMFRREEQA